MCLLLLFLLCYSVLWKTMCTTTTNLVLLSKHIYNHERRPTFSREQLWPCIDTKTRHESQSTGNFAQCPYKLIIILYKGRWINNWFLTPSQPRSHEGDIYIGKVFVVFLAKNKILRSPKEPGENRTNSLENGIANGSCSNPYLLILYL